MAKDMLDAIYNAEEDCRQREANARAESAERVEQTKADAKQVVLSAKEKAQKDADMLFEKTAKEGKKELEKIFSSSFFRLCMSQQNLLYTPQQNKRMSQLRTLPC